MLLVGPMPRLSTCSPGCSVGRDPTHCRLRPPRPWLVDQRVGSAASAFAGGEGQRQALLVPRPAAAAAPCRRRSTAAPRALADVALGGVGWALAGAACAGVLVGLLLAKLAQSWLMGHFDPNKTSRENARLRAKVQELQQMVVKFEPMAYKDMRLRFTRGVNKAVILGLVDELLAKKEVNIWWLPDSVERIFYFNVISLMLSVLDEVVEGMSVNFAGHNVKLQLTYLDLGEAQYGGSSGAHGSSGSQGGSGQGGAALLPAA